MRGLGTIINAFAILIGGILGIGLKRFLKEHYQETILKATGFAVLFLGAAGTLSRCWWYQKMAPCLTQPDL